MSNLGAAGFAGAQAFVKRFENLVRHSDGHDLLPAFAAGKPTNTEKS
jgi:hypothetical protein